MILILLWRIRLPRWRPCQRSFRSDGAGAANSQRPGQCSPIPHLDFLKSVSYSRGDGRGPQGSKSRERIPNELPLACLDQHLFQSHWPDLELKHNVTNKGCWGPITFLQVPTPHAKGSRGGSSPRWETLPLVPPNPSTSLSARTSGLRKGLAGGPLPERSVTPERATASLCPVRNCAENPLDAGRPRASLPAPILASQPRNPQRGAHRPNRGGDSSLGTSTGWGSGAPSPADQTWAKSIDAGAPGP